MPNFHHLHLILINAKKDVIQYSRKIAYGYQLPCTSDCHKLLKFVTVTSAQFVLSKKNKTRSWILFFIGNKTFTEKNEHHVHDDEHSEHETNAHRSRTKANNM